MSVRLALAAVALTACGRLGFEGARGSASLDDASSIDGVTSDSPADDANIDTMPVVTCWPQWVAHTVALGPAINQNLAAGALRDSSLANNDLEINFDIKNGDTDIYVAKRASRNSAWGPAQEVTELNTTTDDDRITTDATNTIGVFSSFRYMSTAELFYTTRSSPTAQWSNIARLASTSTSDFDFDPELSGDGLELFFAPSPGIGLGQKIRSVSRSISAQGFGVSAEVTELNVDYANADVTLSPDGLVMVFRTATAGGIDRLRYTTRTSRTATWAAPMFVPDVATDDIGDPELSSDGCELFYTLGPEGSQQIYLSKIVN